MLEKGKTILEKLGDSGYEAYFAGGCVRDTIMSRPINDIDITTSALPEEVIAVFGEKNTFPTGIAHGTVTVRCGGITAEVTTFRVDGEYSDSRRPDSVSFTRSLTDDLSRRDFTVNSMAMDISGTIIDPHGGRDDIARGVIRCVGDPEKRFTEDALRIMRALRFSSQLGFTIDPATAAAVRSMKERLKLISAERVRDELDKLICGTDCVRVLLEYSDVISVMIPEIKACIGFDQRSPYHKYTVWEHIVRAVSAAPPDDVKLRRALLLHDVAKPACARFDETGRGHFKGHDKLGAQVARAVMRRLRYDRASVIYAESLIAHHSAKIRDKIEVRRMMSELGDEMFFELMKMKICDNTAKNPFVLDENRRIEELTEAAREMVANGECRSLKQLNISGSDLEKLGFSGEEIGEALRELLEEVFLGNVPNERTALLTFTEKRWAE